jgi:predicted peptidase
MRALTLLWGPALAPADAADEDVRHGFLNRVHKDADGKEAKYVVFVPYDYTGDKPYPLILFLHSSSEFFADIQSPDFHAFTGVHFAAWGHKPAQKGV